MSVNIVSFDVGIIQAPIGCLNLLENFNLISNK